MIKIFNTKDNKKGIPLNYFYFEMVDDYPSSMALDEHIPTEHVIKYAINEFKKRKTINVIKNRDFKTIDVVYFGQWNTFGVNKKFKDIFESKLDKAYFFKTNHENYWIMVVDNVLDCIDYNASNLIYDNNDLRPYTYQRCSTIVIDEKQVKGQLIFSTLQDPQITFCTEEFIKICEQYKIKNIVFEDF